jgi:gliding motility-associated lipoprotein GldB
MRNYFQFLLVLLFFISCQKETQNNIDISNIEANFKVFRFEQDFYTNKGQNLVELKENFPLLFPDETPDSIWIAKINNPDEQELFQETQKKYNSLLHIEEELSKLIKHIKYYNPTFLAPDVITILSNIDYTYRTIYTDNLLFISLDVYLGDDHPFYSDYPSYIRKNNTDERIVVDVASNIINSTISFSNNRSFLAKMIHEGKKMYLLDLYLPSKLDPIKIGYSKDKFDWATMNEEQVWRYFIENDLLYSTDTQLNKRFIENAPFSKFYLSEDTKSPGRIGQWIGWQIVRSYMVNNDVSLQDLLSMNEEEIFKNSKYKPRK